MGSRSGFAYAALLLNPDRDEVFWPLGEDIQGKPLREQDPCDVWGGGVDICEVIPAVDFFSPRDEPLGGCSQVWNITSKLSGDALAQ